MIAIVSHLEDTHATEVMAQLQQRGAEALLLDTARFPRELQLNIGHATGNPSRLEVAVDGKNWNLADARVVWWRRPMPIVLHSDLGDAEGREFAYSECHAAISGLWSCLDAHWVNNPERDEIAARKAWQLQIASQIGMRIPRTLVTNDPARARAFAEEEGSAGTIYKAFLATESAWRETRLLKPDELEMIDAVQFAPVIFQEHIAADIDLRITVIGNKIFATEIVSGDTEYKVDFRMTMHQAAVRPHTLPGAVEKQLRSYMKVLGLIYGAIDMRLTPEGEYVFLEINPACQWQFMAERTGQPITEAMTDYLITASRQ